MPTPDPSPAWLNDALAMESWSVPGDLRLLVVLHFHSGEIRFSLCRLAKPEFKLLRLPSGLTEAEIHGFLDQLATQVRTLGNLGREPRPDRLGIVLVEAGRDFRSGLADVMTQRAVVRGGWKSSGDEEPDGDGDGCRGA